MRMKLRDMGVGTQITFYGQYERVGGHNTILMTNLYNKENQEYLCDHIWMCKSSVPYRKKHDDVVVVKGSIYEYTKYYNQIDYNIMPTECYLIRPLVYQDEIVFLNVTSSANYWFYTDRHGFDGIHFYKLNTREIEHLYLGYEEEKGYEILEDDEDGYILYYEKKDSRVNVYKSLEVALSKIDFKELIEK